MKKLLLAALCIVIGFSIATEAALYAQAVNAPTGKRTLGSLGSTYCALAGCTMTGDLDITAGDVVVSDTATNTVTHLTIDHETSGTPLASFGTGILLDGENSAGTQQTIGAIKATWTSPTAGAAESKMCFWTADYGDDDLAARVCIDKDGVVTDGATYLKLGTAAATTHALTSGGVLVGGALEVDGVSLFDAGATFYASAYFRDATPVYFGTSSDEVIWHATATTPNSMEILVGAESNRLIIAEKADSAVAWNLPQAANPTISLMSASTNPAHRVDIYHNQTNGVIDVGTGVLSISDSTSITGDLTVSGNIFGTAPYAEMYQRDNASATTINTQDVWEEVDNFSSGALNGWTHATGDLTAGASAAGVYKVCGAISSAAGLANKTYEFAFSIDNVIKDNCVSKRYYSATDVGSQSLCCLLTFAASGVLKLEVRNRTDTTDLTVVHANVNVNKI